MIVPISGLMFAQSYDSTPLQERMSYTWNILEVRNAAGDKIADPKKSDSFDLRPDGTFILYLANDTSLETGHWDIRDSLLVLQYELIPKQASIDSLAYIAQNDQSILLMFSEGKEVARHSSAGLESERYEQLYRVSFDNRGNPTLRGENRVLSLYGRAQLLQSSFSFSDIIRGLIGILAMLVVCWIFSVNRKAIDWRLVGVGMSLQLILGILVLKIGILSNIFDSFAYGFVTLLTFTDEGSAFIFGSLVTDLDNFGLIFAFKILPTIVFFSAITAVLYYLGVLQRVTYVFALLLSKTMRLSGAESLAAAGNIFLGQTESPLLVRPYLEKMTKSEIMALMTGGMATIAGGVFAAYVGYLGGSDPVQQQLFAKHLLTASIMSAPAALVAAKILIPETEEVNTDLSVPQEKLGSNILDAISRGTTDGLKLAVNVGVMLLVFTAIMALLNGFFAGIIGEYTGLNDWVFASTEGRYSEFNLQYILGLVFAPVAWLLGVPAEDMLITGQLLGEKTILNEFYAYATLGEIKSVGLVVHQKSVIIATYALCGFANFASIGIQLGGIGALAPNQRKTLSELGLRALLGGTVAAFLTAAIAGMLYAI